MRTIEDPRVRLAAKAIEIFSKNTIFKRRPIYEDNLIKNNIYEAMRALRKNKFASFKNDSGPTKKTVTLRLSKKFQIVKPPSETKDMQVKMQKKLQSYQSFKILSKGPVL